MPERFTSGDAEALSYIYYVLQPEDEAAERADVLRFGQEKGRGLSENDRQLIKTFNLCARLPRQL